MTQNPRRPRVLIIDDTATVRTQLVELLETHDIDVLEAENGFDALAMVVDADPDLIFTDINMPILDGYETVTLLRSNPSFLNTPVVMLSSKSGVFDIAKGKLIGCDSYIVKPVSGTAVQELLQQFLPSFTLLNQAV